MSAAGAGTAGWDPSVWWRGNRRVGLGSRPVRRAFARSSRSGPSCRVAARGMDGGCRVRRVGTWWAGSTRAGCVTSFVLV